MIHTPSKSRLVSVLATAQVFSILLAWQAEAQNQPINQTPVQQQQQQQQQQQPAGEIDISLLRTGRALFDQRRFAEALQAFNNFKDQRPSNLSVHFWLATTLAALGRDADAMAEYVNCVNLSAYIGLDSPELRSNLANCLSRSGYTKETLYDYQRAGKIDPRCPPPYLGVAKCLIDNGDFDEALRALDDYKKSGGQDINALFLHGLALAGKDQYEPARQDLTNFVAAARTGGNRGPLDQNLSVADDHYVTAGSVSTAALDLAGRILNQLPAKQP